MTTALTNTLHGLTGKYSLDEIYTEELIQLVKDYPYFAPAQIALAAKYKSQGHVSTQTQIQKTGLFVSNTKWLQFQLMDLSKIKFTKEEPIVEPTSNNSLLPHIDIPSIEDVKQMMGDKVLPEETVLQESVANTLTKEVVAEAQTIIDKPIAEPVSTILANQLEPEVQQTVAETLNPVIEEPILSESIAKETSLQPVQQQELATPPQIQEPAFVPFEETQAVPEATQLIEAVQTVSTEVHTTESVLTEESVIEPTKIDTSNDIHAQIARLREQWHKPVAETEKLPFEAEPYYTIDYFESQGIKFDYKNNANDDLTKKVLKFTDWLKRMKNPTNNAFNQSNEQGEELDKAIQGIAQTSNQPKEIVTETMAEVFEKQGDIEKAIQLYIKLSFLNPTKTAYFAARIQKLKGI